MHIVVQNTKYIIMLSQKHTKFNVFFCVGTGTCKLNPALEVDMSLHTHRVGSLSNFVSL